MNKKIFAAKRAIEYYEANLKLAKDRLADLEAKAKQRDPRENSQPSFGERKAPIGLFALETGSLSAAAEKFCVSKTTVINSLAYALHRLPGYNREEHKRLLKESGRGEWSVAKDIYQNLSSNVKSN